MSVLLYYRVQTDAYVNQVFQAVLIAHESVTPRGNEQRTSCGNGWSLR